ncbi:hypothetical protein FOZ60_004432 [Perkinsus olseni]|uniref:Uncharacterized protein n=2 Tax=Perkinsus olseni TaxID=32597 RepID=A0A7J6PPL6_PEROL|nr:hypothetical protein FOZ60_004432 [Perkinsus olseni]
MCGTSLKSPELWDKLVATNGAGLTEAEQKQILEELNKERAYRLKTQQELHRKRNEVNREKEMIRKREQKVKEEQITAELEERQQRREEELKIWLDKKETENRERLARERAQIRALQDAERVKKEREKERQELFDKEREARLRRAARQQANQRLRLEQSQIECGSGRATSLSLSGGSTPVLPTTPDLEVRQVHHHVHYHHGLDAETLELSAEEKLRIEIESEAAIIGDECRTRPVAKEDYLVPLPRQDMARAKKLKKFFKSTQDAFATLLGRLCSGCGVRAREMSILGMIEKPLGLSSVCMVSGLLVALHLLLGSVSTKHVMGCTSSRRRRADDSVVDPDLRPLSARATKQGLACSSPCEQGSASTGLPLTPRPESPDQLAHGRLLTWSSRPDFSARHNPSTFITLGEGSSTPAVESSHPRRPHQVYFNGKMGHRHVLLMHTLATAATAAAAVAFLCEPRAEKASGFVHCILLYSLLADERVC